MTEPFLSPVLDRDAVARWQERLAAHLLGAGLAVAVIIALPTAPTDLDRHQLPKETVVHLVTWLAVTLLRPGVGALSRATRTALVALLLGTAASALFAENRWLALRATALSTTGVAALLTAHQLGRLGLGQILLRWSVVAAMVGTGLGLAQAYGVTSPLFATTRLPGGTFGNRNFLAHFASLALPSFALLVLGARRLAGALLPLLGVALLAGAIVLTRSRAAWLASAAGGATLVLALWQARRHGALPVARLHVVLLAVALVLGPVITLTTPNVLEWRSDSPYAETLTGLANAQEGSGRGRVLQYRNTLAMAVAHPLLGVGPGNWPLRYGEVAPPTDPSWVWGDDIPLNPWPSSDWMALLSERGVPVLLAALLLGLSLAWRSVRQLRLAGDRALHAAALLGTLAAIVVVGMFDALLLLPVPLLGAAMMVGALSPTDTEGDGVVQTATPRAARILPLLLAVVVARSVQQTAAYLIAGSGRDLQRVGWAARLDPTSFPLRIELASRLPCGRARSHARAALALAPEWPASRAAARRCGVR